MEIVITAADLFTAAVWIITAALAVLVFRVFYNLGVNHKPAWLARRLFGQSSNVLRAVRETDYGESPRHPNCRCSIVVEPSVVASISGQGPGATELGEVKAELRAMKWAAFDQRMDEQREAYLAVEPARYRTRERLKRGVSLVHVSGRTHAMRLEEDTDTGDFEWIIEKLEFEKPQVEAGVAVWPTNGGNAVRLRNDPPDGDIKPVWTRVGPSFDCEPKCWKAIGLMVNPDKSGRVYDERAQPVT